MSHIGNHQEIDGLDWMSRQEGEMPILPDAPRLKNIEIAPVLSADASSEDVTVIWGAEEVLPEHLIFMPGRSYFSRQTDHRLRYTEQRRPVLEPLGIEVSSEDYLIWGAAMEALDELGMGITLGPLEDSERRIAPATSPPIRSIWIFPEDGSVIVVRKRPGMGFVTVADVQDAVIHWMEDNQDQIGPETISPSVWQGNPVQEELGWLWRGLVQRGERLDVWELRL